MCYLKERVLLYNNSTLQIYIALYTCAKFCLCSCKIVVLIEFDWSKTVLYCKHIMSEKRNIYKTKNQQQQNMRCLWAQVMIQNTKKEPEIKIYANTQLHANSCKPCWWMIHTFFFSSFRFVIGNTKEWQCVSNDVWRVKSIKESGSYTFAIRNKLIDSL